MISFTFVFYKVTKQLLLVSASVNLLYLFYAVKYYKSIKIDESNGK
ncbi:MAG: hypothetical protein H6Q70_2272 [Firmicutes bacterium]|nr:hypothetical protein [Bacillota bacterium]